MDHPSLQTASYKSSSSFPPGIHVPIGLGHYRNERSNRSVEGGSQTARGTVDVLTGRIQPAHQFDRALSGQCGIRPSHFLDFADGLSHPLAGKSCALPAIGAASEMSLEFPLVLCHLLKPCSSHSIGELMVWRTAGRQTDRTLVSQPWQCRHMTKTPTFHFFKSGFHTPRCNCS